MPWEGERLLARARRAWVARSLDDRALVIPPGIPSELSDDECRRLGELAAGKRVLELGTYFGKSTIVMASTAEVVHTVDLHPDAPGHGAMLSTLPAFLENVERYDLRHRVVAHFGFSQLVVPTLPQRWFDLVFLDAQHQREPVEEDVALVLPHLREDGVLAFHDYGVPGVEHRGTWDAFGVTEVVDELAAARGLEVELTRTLAVLRLGA